MKRLVLAAVSATALTLSSAPALGQENDPTGDELAQVAEMFGGMFTADELTEEQQTRLPQAEALMAVMMPEGFYAEMMSEMMGTTLEPMMTMISGEGGANLLLGSRINADPEDYAGLSGAEKVEVARLLDPGFAERGRVMQEFMANIMVDVATDIEPGFRAGMAKAYAVRFDAAQLADIAAFFATPTGQLYATENMKLMADPQVMSATMEAMPQMMQRIGSLEGEMRAAMEAVPAERGVDEMSAQERARLAELLGVDESDLGDLVSAPAGDDGDLYQDTDEAAEDAAEDAT